MSEDKKKITGIVDLTVPYTVTYWCYENSSVSRTELAKHGRCIDREAGLDCGCLICGRE